MSQDWFLKDNFQNIPILRNKKKTTKKYNKKDSLMF